MSNTPRDNSTIESKICKTDEEAINSEAFYKGFSLCLKKIENLENKEVYEQILEKIKSQKEAVTYDEYNYLEQLLKNNEFIKIANEIFNKSVVLSGTNEEFKNSKINIDSMKSYLLNNIYTSLITNRTNIIVGDNNDETGSIKPEFENDFIEIYRQNKITTTGQDPIYLKYKSSGEIKEFRRFIDLDSSLIGLEEKGKGFILLNEKGEQISEEGESYGYVYALNCGLIGREIIGQYELLDNKGKKITGEKYSGIDELTNGLIIGYQDYKNKRVSDKIGVLIDNNGKQISDNTYNIMQGRFDRYIDETGLIKLFNETNGYHTLVNAKGEEVDISNTGYYYDDEKEQFYKVIKIKKWFLSKKIGEYITNQTI